MKLILIIYTVVLGSMIWNANDINAQEWPVEVIKSDLVGAWSRPGDFDNDDDQDLLIQNGDTLFWYENPYPLPAIVRIPQDYPSIQAGINAAVDGDTVLVSDSTYYENINFMGKKITVASLFIIDGDTNHVNNTIIDGSQPSTPDSASVVFFISGEDTNSVLTGFTIMGGSGTQYFDPMTGYNRKCGGGVLFSSSGGLIISNIIEYNQINTDSMAMGGAIYSGPGRSNKYVIIEDNTIRNNSIMSPMNIWAGGILMRSYGRIVNNLIIGNSLNSEQGWAAGGGISCSSPDTTDRKLVTITGNIVTNNSAYSNGTFGGYGGGIDVWGSDVEVRDNEISYNTISAGSFCFAPGMRLTYSTENSIVQNNDFLFNSFTNGSSNGGGLVLVMTRGVRVMVNHFEGNSGTWGGGITEYQTSLTLIENNRFLYNEVTQDGGAIDSNSPSIIRNNLIEGNKANRGGAIDIYPYSEEKGSEINGAIKFGSIETTNMEVAEQELLHHLSLQESLEIQNNTIVNNIASVSGGAIFSGGEPDFTLMNSIVYFNASPDSGQISGNTANVIVEYCDIQGGYTGTGNIDLDPLFADTIDFYLSSTSPVVDAGDPDSAYYDPEDPNNPGYAMHPSLGTVANDMGAYGGPGVIPDDSITVSINDEFSDIIPDRTSLSQNYPNPFNPSTTIEFYMPKSGFVTLKIFNILGQEVATLVSENLHSGIYKYNWDAGHLASGVYFYEINVKSFGETENFKQVRKLILLR